jgi:hypothetical protein
MNSEAGEKPALSRNGDAPSEGMSPDACPVPRNLSSEEGRFVGCLHRLWQRAHFVLFDPVEDKTCGDHAGVGWRRWSSG